MENREHCRQSAQETQQKSGEKQTVQHQHLRPLRDGKGQLERIGQSIAGHVQLNTLTKKKAEQADQLENLDYEYFVERANLSPDDFD